MRLVLQTVLCCCALTLMLPLVRGAGGDLNAGLKRRLRAWLHGHSRRELQAELCRTIRPGTQEDQAGDPAQTSRLRRSLSSKGCMLVTCAYQDLLHRLHIFNNNHKEATAPVEKITSQGYGRRRRRRSLRAGRRPRGTTGGRRRGRGQQSPARVA